MFSLDKLVSMGFTVAQATVINKLFKRVGYAAKFTTNDLVSGASIPANKIIQINTISGLKEIFKTDTQFYIDIETILTQKGNTNPWQGNVETVVVYQVSESDYGLAVDNFVKVNANWSQLCIDSRTVADRKSVV